MKRVAGKAAARGVSCEAMRWVSWLRQKQAEEAEACDGPVCLLVRVAVPPLVRAPLLFAPLLVSVLVSALVSVSMSVPVWEWVPAPAQPLRVGGLMEAEVSLRGEVEEEVV